MRLGAAVVIASAGALVAIGGTAGAEPVDVEFEFTGAEQTWVVPEGVCSLTVDAYGAQGGNGSEFADDNGVGGEGGRATATIAVTPGETLYVYVGEEGHDGPTDTITSLEADPDDDQVGVAPAGLPATGAGGFNGGGDGGGADLEEFQDAGGGGGGASDVRQGGNALSNRVVVAGGGGGGGGDATDEGSPPDGNGGDGGGLEGTAGNPSGEGTPPGEGGTQTAGGAAPTASDPTAVSGELGQGGGGGIGIFLNDGGGGGGGGYFGGGGGAGDAENTDDGAGGGGGSGFGPAGVAFETGVQDGDGFVSITWDPAVQTCPIVLEPRFTG